MIESKEITNPFPGLRPFETDEYRLFFGRDGQSDALIARLERSHFLAVVGTSGSGKSSLVRAGLLPALRGGMMATAGSGWRIAIMRPGSDPIGNLAGELAENGVLPEAAGGLPPAEAEAVIEAMLRRGSLGLVDAARQARLREHEKLLVVVDQFEELFRFRVARAAASTEDDAAAFVKLLLEASRQRELSIYVVPTMRSDFLGDCAQFQGLPEAINDGQYLIPRMTRDERRSAVTGPVGVKRRRITEPLVNRLMNDVGDNPDQLPILQHALMRTWDYWSAHRANGESIGLEHYEAIGTMAEALSRHADEAFAELPDERSRHIAEKLFKRLTEKGTDNRETRRPTRLTEICDVAEATEDEVVAVIDVFRHKGRSFLMPPAEVKLHGETVIDISHESLIRNWKRLQTWVDEEAQSARTYRRLADDALLHLEGKVGLLDDPRLQLTLDWRDKQRPTGAWAARYHDQFNLVTAFPNAKDTAERHAELFDVAMTYLEESRRARDAAVAERERQRNAELEGERRKSEQAERYAADQARANRKLRLMMVALGIMLLLAVGAAGYAMKQRRDALKSAAVAKDKEQEAMKKTEALAAALKIRDEADEARKAAEEGRMAARMGEERALQEALEEKNRANAQARLARANAAKARATEADAKTRAKEAEDALAAKKTAEEAAAKTAGKDKLNKEALEALQRYEFTKAGKMFSRLVGLSTGDATDEGWATYNLGAVYLKQGRYSEAEEEYKKALVILHAQLGGGRQLAATMIGLAQVYRESRKYREAERQYTDLLGAAILDSPADADDYLPLIAEVSANRGDIYREQGKFVDALKSYDKAFETWLQVKSDSVSLADRFKGIAQFYLEQERDETAEKLYLRAYAIWSKYLAEGNPAFARDIEEVGSMYRARKKYAEAEKYYVEARKAWEQQALSGTEKSSRYRNLAQFYLEWGKTLESAPTQAPVIAKAKQLNTLADETLGKALDTVAPVASNPVSAQAVDALLPESGEGYVTNNRGGDGEFQFGRAATIRAIITLGVEWKRQHPLVPFSVGRISRKGGGPLPPFLTHRLGNDFDIRPLRNDGLNQPITISDPNYSSTLTKELVLLIKHMYPNAIIFFNDHALVDAGLTRRVTGYDNHLHIRLP